MEVIIIIPTKEDIIRVIIEECNIIGLPNRIGLAICKTESQFKHYNSDGTVLEGEIDKNDKGAMQINIKIWGNQYNTSDIINSWKYNIKYGIEIAYKMYQLAIAKNADSLHQATYSAYNAGEQNMFRYKTGKDKRDINFLNNYNQLKGY